MTNAIVRMHPEVLFAFTTNHAELRIRIENPDNKLLWIETEVAVPEGISLSPTSILKRGRLRFGIIDKKEFIEKSVRIYGNSMTAPQIYCAKIVVYSFNKDGVIDSRIEKDVDIRCEVKKEASL